MVRRTTMKTRITLILISLLMIGGLFAQYDRSSRDNRTPVVQEATRAVTNESVFADFLAGGYLMPISINYFSSDSDDIEGLSSVNLSILRWGINNMKIRGEKAPIVMGYLGLFDNAGLTYASVKDEEKTAFYADIVSAYAGVTYPVLNYLGYVNVGAKLSAFTQTPLYEEIELGGAKYKYVYDFEDDNGDRTIKESTPITAGLELAARGGFRVYQNFFLSLTAGMRYNTARDGNWYLKSDVDDWTSGNAIFEPDPWLPAATLPLPERNTIFEGASPFIGISLGTNF